MDIVYYCRKDDNIDLIEFQKHLFNKNKELMYPDGDRTPLDILQWINSDIIYFHLYDNNIIKFSYYYDNDDFINYKKNNIQINYINIKNYLLTEKLKTII